MTPPSYQTCCICLCYVSPLYLKQAQTSLFFNPYKYILTSFTTLYLLFFNSTFFSFNVQKFIFFTAVEVVIGAARIDLFPTFSFGGTNNATKTTNATNNATNNSTNVTNAINASDSNNEMKKNAFGT